jgi:hypothetical protein
MEPPPPYQEDLTTYLQEEVKRGREEIATLQAKIEDLEYMHRHQTERLENEKFFVFILLMGLSVLMVVDSVYSIGFKRGASSL